MNVTLQKRWLVDAALFAGFLACFFLDLTGVGRSGLYPRRAHPSGNMVRKGIYFSLKNATSDEPSWVVMVTRKHTPGSLGVCQFWMNWPATES